MPPGYGSGAERGVQVQARTPCAAADAGIGTAARPGMSEAWGNSWPNGEHSADRRRERRRRFDDMPVKPKKHGCNRRHTRAMPNDIRHRPGIPATVAAPIKRRSGPPPTVRPQGLDEVD